MASGGASVWTVPTFALTAAAAAAAGAAITHYTLRQQRAGAAYVKPAAQSSAEARAYGDCSCSIAVVEPALQKADPFDGRPRREYLSWEDYFMAVAFLSAQRSKDPNKQVGACIVSPDKIILGIGYNGFPRGCPDDKLPWSRQAHSGDPLDTKYPYVCHAELNAILNKNVASLHGAAIYVTMFPCCECAKLLIQAGIREVIFFEDKALPVRPASAPLSGIRPEALYAASRRLLAMAGVRVRQHRLERPLMLQIGC